MQPGNFLLRNRQLARRSSTAFQAPPPNRSEAAKGAGQNRINLHPLSVKPLETTLRRVRPDFLFAPRVEGTIPTTDIIKALAEDFAVSLTAAAQRYIELSEDYCVLVVSEGNKIRWWRASRAFDGRLWLDARTALPANSVAARFFRGESVPADPQPIDLRDWLGNLSGIADDIIYEQATPLPSYHQVLSMLWLA
jgi:hypothetical protein